MKNFCYGFLTCLFFVFWIFLCSFIGEPDEGLYWLDSGEVYQVKRLRQMRKDGQGFILTIHKNDWLNPNSNALRSMSGCFIDNKGNYLSPRQPIDSLTVHTMKNDDLHNRLIEEILKTVDKEFYKEDK